jgi:hypothetical protein
MLNLNVSSAPALNAAKPPSAQEDQLELPDKLDVRPYGLAYRHARLACACQPLRKTWTLD